MKHISTLFKIGLLSGIMLLLAAQEIHAQNFFSNGQANAGPDTTICLGSSVTLGEGSADPTYCYHWEPATGLDNPNSLHPNASPTSTTNYTLYVTGPNFSFKDSDAVTVSVVEIKNMTFNPSQVPVNSTTTASVTTVPSGRQIEWSIEGPNLGCSINSSTGVITAGNQGGTITVRAADVLFKQMGIDCYTEETLCIGDGSDCCVEQSGTKSFGPITFSIPNAPLAPAGQQDAQGYCPYQVDAAINLDMLGTFQKSFSLTGVSISWKEKYDNPSDYKDVTITWAGNYNLATFGLIGANLTQISLTVNSGGNLSGTCTFTVNQTQDVSIGSIAILKQGLSGSFTYNYSNSNGWNGNWDFGGITGFEVHLMKGSSPIAKVTAQSFDANGNINNATLSAVTPGVWTTNGFTATLEQLALSFNYNIANNEIDFLGGTGQVKIENIPNVQGKFTLALIFSTSSVTATVGLDNVEAFGCDISGTLSVDIDYNFDLQVISGTGISAQHQDFDQSFTGVEFEIKDGAVEKFGIGQITIKYKGKVEFSMMNASYVKAESNVQFDAKVELPALQMTVTEFKINTGGGVSVGNITADINQSPVDVHVDVSFATDQFSGNFTGTFTGGIAINGSLTIGATASYNYGHFALSVTTSGIALGTSGLKVKSLSGEFGYNWAAPPPTTSGTASSSTGSPQQGTTTIGFGLGIADMADIVLIEGYVRLTLGAATQIYLKGDVKVTANAPHYFQGTLEIWYTLGSTTISGNINSVTKFPASSGDIVYLNSGNVAFEISNNQWAVTANGMTGKIFDEIDMSCEFQVYSYLSNSNNIHGYLKADLNYDNTFNFAYPSNFNPSSCSTADATDNSVGFGVSGNLELHLGGHINASMSSNGVTGSIGAEASANCTLHIKWPCFVTCGWDCVDTYYAGVEGNITCERTSSSTRIHGDITVSYGNEQESGEIDFTI